MTKKHDILRLEYVALSTCILWDDNTKLHDIGNLIASYNQHGMKKAVRFEPKLNGGKGGIVDGNGRIIALQEMFKENSDNPPRGIQVVDGEWLVPVTFGVDAESEAAAEAYGYDANLTNLAGGDNSLTMYARQFDAGFVNGLKKIMEAGGRTVTLDGVDMQRLIDVQESDYEPIDLELSGGADEREQNESAGTGGRLHRCPKCAFEFED